VVACSLAGWQTDWRWWRAGYLAGYLAGWLRVAGWRFVGGWLSNWLKGYLGLTG